MAYHLKRKETVEQGVQRIARERIGCALHALEARENTEGIHRARKEIKRLRALLRLVRPALGDKVYRRQTKVLRQAASLLAASRDAHVTLKAFHDLNARFKTQLRRAPSGRVKGLLERRCQEAAQRYTHQSAARSVAEALQGLEQNLEGLQLAAKGWASVCPGLNWSYRCGRKARDLALEKPSAENLHEWRKRVKDMWYQALLLRRIQPRQMRALAKELKELSDLLGDDHDLALLRAVAAEQHLDGSDGETLNKLAAQRQEELRSDALVLGARFYAEKPTEFRQRLERYWDVWYVGKGKLKRLAHASVAPS